MTETTKPISEQITWYFRDDKASAELSNPSSAWKEAAFIVRAVNSHDELLAACKRAYEYIPVKVDTHPERTELFIALEQAIDKAEGVG